MYSLFDFQHHEPADMIYADLPMTPDPVQNARSLSAFAAMTLKPGGMLVAYSPADRSAEMMLAIATKSLKHVWSLSIPEESQRIISARKTVVLVFEKEPIPDLIRSNSYLKGCEINKWDLYDVEAIRLIKLFSEPGDVVCEPCGRFPNLLSYACRVTDRRLIVVDGLKQCK